METITNLANSASKAVWGDNTTTATTNETVHPGTETTHNETKGTEPVSGKLGDTSKGEPFDAGNMASGANKDITPTRPAPANNPSTTSLAGVVVDDTNQSKGPTTEHPSTTGDTGFKAAQADTRDPNSSLTTNHETEKARMNVDDTGALDKSENPSKIDGPGPKPIGEVAHERGGDAGAVTRESAHGGAAEGEDGLNAKSKSEGTGEKYIKSSGLAAEGGDFDATKPGAGREADRLLEQRGIVNPATAAAATGPKEDDDHKAAHAEKVSSDKASSDKASTDKASTGSPDPKEKHSLKDKIKAKLHKN